MRAHTHTHVHAHTHTYTHSHTHIYIFTCAITLSLECSVRFISTFMKKNEGAKLLAFHKIFKQFKVMIIANDRAYTQILMYIYREYFARQI